MDKKLKSNFILTENVTTEEAMRTITNNRRGSVIITNDKGKLVGVVSDGDIRRALIKGATLFTPISKVVNPNIISVVKDADTVSKGQIIFSKSPEINLIPVINKKNDCIDILVR